MYKFFLIPALILIGTGAVTATVNANSIGEQEQEQHVEQEAEAICTGSYGQDTTCKLKTKQTVEQEQRQRILAESIVVRGDERIHIPVDTALDTKTTAAAMGVTFIGALAYVAKRKIA